MYAAEDSLYTDPAACPVCGNPLGGLELLPPFHFEYEVGPKKVGDLIGGAGLGSGILCSRKFVDAWPTMDLLGPSEFSPATLKPCGPVRTKALDQSFYFASIPYAGGRADYSKSGAARVDLSSISGHKQELEERGLTRDCQNCGGLRPTWFERVVFQEHAQPTADIGWILNLNALCVVSELFVARCREQDLIIPAVTPVESYGRQGVYESSFPRQYL